MSARWDLSQLAKKSTQVPLLYPCQPINTKVYPTAKNTEQQATAKHHIAISLLLFHFVIHSLLHTHTIWPRFQSCYSSIKGPGGGSGAALSNAWALFDLILDFKEGHLIPALGEVGGVEGDGCGEGSWAVSSVFVKDWYRPSPLFLPFPLVCLSLPRILFQ